MCEADACATVWVWPCGHTRRVPVRAFGPHHWLGGCRSRSQKRPRQKSGPGLLLVERRLRSSYQLPHYVHLPLDGQSTPCQRSLRGVRGAHHPCQGLHKVVLGAEWLVSAQGQGLGILGAVSAPPLREPLLLGFEEVIFSGIKQFKEYYAGLGEMNDWLSAKDHSTHLLEQPATQHNLGLWVIFREGGVGGEQPWGL